MTVEQIKKQIDALSPRERAEIASYAIRSLDPEEDVDEQEIEAAWKAELARRLDAMQSGKAVGIPAEEVMARLREKYPGNRPRTIT